jgi:hypothetical protein
MPYLLLLALTAALGFQTQAKPPRDNAASPTGTAKISGRVTDRDSGRPIQDVTVVLAPSGSEWSSDALRMMAFTDADGGYEISGLPAGGYVLTASPGMRLGAYLGQVLGRDDTMDVAGSPSLTLSAGEVRKNVDVRLARAVAIEGRLVNDYGEPLADLRVVAERWLRGGWTEASLGSRSDDRGMFRVFQLKPGEYRVCTRSDGGRGASDGNVLENSLIPTCSPVRIQLTTTDVTGVELQVQRTGTFTVSGRVVNEAGALARDAQVMLVRIERLGSSAGSDGVVMDKGAFTLKGIVPGEYIIRATVGGGGNSAGDAAEQGSLPLRVESSDVTGLVLPTSRGASVRGRVRVQGTLPASALRRLHVQASPDTSANALPFGRPPVVAISDDGTFELKQLFGQLAIAVNGLPDGWFVNTVTYRHTDITDRLIEFVTSPDEDSLQIVLSNRAAHVTAQVRDADGKAVPGAVVLLIAADPGRRRNPNIAGRRWGDEVIELGPQRPGDYLAVAVLPHDVTRVWREPGMLETVAMTALAVTLREDEHRTLDLRLLSLPADK